MQLLMFFVGRNFTVRKSDFRILHFKNNCCLSKNMNERSVCKGPMLLSFLNSSYPVEISLALLVSEMYRKFIYV